MTGPLEGIRIVDCSAYITGPFATMVLADQGADVVKLEPIGIGDVMRHLGTARGGISTIFAGCNRSKRSLALDLREARGREILYALWKVPTYSSRLPTRSGGANRDRRGPLAKGAPRSDLRLDQCIRVGWTLGEPAGLRPRRASAVRGRLRAGDLDTESHTSSRTRWWTSSRP